MILINNFITLENVCFRYENNTENILKNINLTISRGKFIAILGENGCGKSTLVKLLNALLIPTSGNVIINNLKTNDKKNLSKIRQNVGLLMQNPDHQIFENTVWEDVAFGPRNLGLSFKEVEKRVQKSLENTGIFTLKDCDIDTLSGGQKQKLAIAGVLAMDPQCIVLDESLAMLDPVSANEIFNLIINLNKSHNVTIILITHSVTQAILADEIIIMNKGRIVTHDSPDKIFSLSKKNVLEIENEVLKILQYKKGDE